MMAVIRLKHSEIADVLDILSQRGLELCYSVEPDGVYVYGSDSELEEVESILWARDVIQGMDFHQEAGVSYAISMPNR